MVELSCQQLSDTWFVYLICLPCVPIFSAKLNTIDIDEDKRCFTIFFFKKKVMGAYQCPLVDTDPKLSSRLPLCLISPPRVQQFTSDQSLTELPLSLNPHKFFLKLTKKKKNFKCVHRVKVKARRFIQRVAFMYSNCLQSACSALSSAASLTSCHWCRCPARLW